MISLGFDFGMVSALLIGKETEMTKYEVIKTTTGKFRIKATYPDGFSVMVGGEKSRKYCFFSLEAAQRLCDEFNNAEERYSNELN